VKNRRVALLLLAVWVAALTGCNTMHGLGRDIETLGDKIQRKSSR
jgi:predicted small secreted protein